MSFSSLGHVLWDITLQLTPAHTSRYLIKVPHKELPSDTKISLTRMTGKFRKKITVTTDIQVAEDDFIAASPTQTVMLWMRNNMCFLLKVNQFGS